MSGTRHRRLAGKPGRISEAPARGRGFRAPVVRPPASADAHPCPSSCTPSACPSPSHPGPPRECRTNPATRPAESAPQPASWSSPGSAWPWSATATALGMATQLWLMESATVLLRWRPLLCLARGWVGFGAVRTRSGRGRRHQQSTGGVVVSSRAECCVLRPCRASAPLSTSRLVALRAPARLVGEHLCLTGSRMLAPLAKLGR